MAKKRIALLLGGGGARGAYQAGILKAWKPIFKKNPSIDVICGVSAGSINAVKLVQHADNPSYAVDEMCKLWLSLKPEMIFETSFREVVKNLLRLTRSSRKDMNPESTTISHSILSTRPLYQFLIRHFDMGMVHQALEKNPELTFAVNCFDYTDMKNVAFFQTQADMPGWERPTRRGIKTTITIKHIIASCAVPLIFPTINIGDHYYGDGSLRNLAPLNPLIKLGADRIICIHLRGRSMSQRVVPSLANVAGAVYESMFLDSIEYDSQILNRINILNDLTDPDKRLANTVDLCRISPLINFGDVADKFRGNFPRTLMRMLGGWISPTLLSFLLFDKDYSKVLIDQGLKDGKLYYDIVEDWLLNPQEKE